MSEDPFPLDLLLEPPPDVLPRLLTRWLGLPRDPRPGPASMLLPAALASGLGALSGWPGAFRQNRLRAVDDIDAVDGIARFLVEPQGTCFWGFSLADADLPDPRVWIEHVIDGRRIADPLTSRFLLKMTMLELVLAGRELEVGPGRPAPGAATPDDLLAGLSRLVALGPLTWPTTCWFYAGPDELAMSMDGITGRRDWAWRAGRPRVPAAAG